MKGARIAVQGFGAVGKHAARFLAQKGALLVAASDTGGTLADPSGLDVGALIALKEAGQPLHAHGNGSKLAADAILDIDCDIWVPAARPDVVRADNVSRLRTRLMPQGANIPCTPEAERALHERGVLVVPDFIANAGGVICAAVEYRGGMQRGAFDYIDERIRANVRSVLEESRRHKAIPRAAAVALAERRVRAAMKTRPGSAPQARRFCLPNMSEKETTMNRHAIPLGKILGISIGLDYSWFVIFALLTWMLAGSYYPEEFKHWSPLLYWLTGAITAIMLFVSVLLHELGHSVIALRYRIPVSSITLFLFGGVAQIEAEPPSAIAEFFIAIAGPLVSLALAVFFYATQPLVAGMEPLLGLAKYLAYINMALVLFNLIPGYPLDGGRVLRAIVWAITGDMDRSTLIAAAVGRFCAFLLIFAGTWQMFKGNFGGGLWVAFIGWFLDSAASVQIQQVMFRGLLTGHRVSQAMSTHCAIIPEDMTLQQLVDEQILVSGQRSFLVNRGDQTVGLITLHRIKEVPRAEWATTSATRVMLPIEQLKCVDPDTELWSALEKMDRNGVNQMPVIRDQHVIGMLSREDAITFLRTLQEFGTSSAQQPKPKRS